MFSLYLFLVNRFRGASREKRFRKKKGSRIFVAGDMSGFASAPDERQ